jgi:tetratricopeptide (TPR) repeat protein
MAWRLDRATLEAGRDEMLQRVAERPVHRLLEQLARAHLWLDEVDEARRRFREAAADLEERIEKADRGDASSRGRRGGLLRMAGDPEAARPWFERALAETRDVGHAAALRYLLGDPRGALEEAGRADERYPKLEWVAALARARDDEDPEAAVEARHVLAVVVRTERTLPFEESGHPDLSVFDWLEEAFRTEAELRGQAVPSHAEMLDRLTH